MKAKPSWYRLVGDKISIQVRAKKHILTGILSFCETTQLLPPSTVLIQIRLNSTDDEGCGERLSQSVSDGSGSQYISHFTIKTFQQAR